MKKTANLDHTLDPNLPKKFQANSNNFTWTKNDNMWYLLLDLEMPDLNDIRARVIVNEDSPWFSGHFPGRPILPGIAQLKMAADVIALARQERLWIKRLHRVKFKRIVNPGEQLDIHVAAMDTGNLYSFRISHATEDVCAGAMSLEHQQYAETTHE